MGEGKADMGLVNQPLTSEAAKKLMVLDVQDKEMLTYEKLDEWYTAWGGQCYVSFSGGKDSTVLAYLAARYLASYKTPVWPLNLVFVNTGLEYPEIQKFVNEYAEWLRREFPRITVNLVRLRPKMNIRQVVTKYGYSIVSKDVAACIVSAKNNPDSLHMKRLRGEAVGNDGRPSIYNCEKWEYGDWRDRAYEEIADACRRQYKSENENQLDDKIYIVVPKGVTPVMIFDNGKERESDMTKFSKAMMMPGNLHEGDYVETVAGRVGYIKDICRCEKCQERGFYEPTVRFTDGGEGRITAYEVKTASGGYRRIGRWANEDIATLPHAPIKGSQNKRIEKIERMDVMKKGNVWDDRSGGWLSAQQKKINELVDAVNQMLSKETAYE